MNHLLQKYFSAWFPLDKLKTDYQYLEVVGRNNKVLLNARHTNYSFGSLHNIFAHAFRQLSPDYKQFKDILILGFGAGSIAWILQKENHCSCHITGVEIDQKVMALAEKYFHLNKINNLKICIADAADFLSGTSKQYDLIAVDLFLDFRTPKKFLTAEFLSNLYSHLHPNGMVLFNFLKYDFKAKKKALFFEQDFRSIFKGTKLLTFKKQPKSIIFYGKRVKEQVKTDRLFRHNPS